MEERKLSNITPPDPKRLKEIAKEHYDEGFNIVPVKLTKGKNGKWEKEFFSKWKEWKTIRQTEGEFANLPWDVVNGYAVICTQLKSKNNYYFCVVDYDSKVGGSEEQKELGRKVFEALPETYEEETINGGGHKCFLSKEKPEPKRFVQYKKYGIELLGSGQLCIMWPSMGYKVIPSPKGTIKVEDINQLLEKTIEKCGVKREQRWFDANHIIVPYRGHHPPCIKGLESQGVPLGQRNDVCMRISGYYLLYRRVSWKRAVQILRKWNGKNDPPFTDEELLQEMREAKQY